MNRRDLFKRTGACALLPIAASVAAITPDAEPSLAIDVEFPSGVYHPGTRVIPAGEIILGSMIETNEGLSLEVIDDAPYHLGDRVVLDLSDAREGYHVAKFEKKVCIVNQLHYVPNCMYHGTMGIRIIPTERCSKS